MVTGSPKELEYIVKAHELDEEALSRLALLIASALVLSYGVRKGVVLRILVDRGGSCMVLSLESSKIRRFSPDCGTAVGFLRSVLRKGRMSGALVVLEELPCTAVARKLLSNCGYVLDLTSEAVASMCFEGFVRKLCVILDLTMDPELYPGGPKIKPWWVPSIVSVAEVICKLAYQR